MARHLGVSPDAVGSILLSTHLCFFCFFCFFCILMFSKTTLILLVYINTNRQLLCPYQFHEMLSVQNDCILIFKYDLLKEIFLKSYFAVSIKVPLVMHTKSAKFVVGSTVVRLRRLSRFLSSTRNRSLFFRCSFCGVHFPIHRLPKPHVPPSSGKELQWPHSVSK